MEFKNLERVKYNNSDWFVLDVNEEVNMIQLIRYGVTIWVFNNEVSKIKGVDTNGI